MKSIRISPTSIISICDAPDNEIIVNGRVWRFDFDRHLGPTWLKKNGEDRKCQNPNKQVWDAFGKWFNEYNLKKWKSDKRPTPETDAVAAIESNWDTKALRMINHARKLERERDHANEELSKKYIEYDKLFDKAYQIRIERDQANEELAHWKIEYEIVEARLHGMKHERDNGIISEQEIIPKLKRHLDEAIELLKEASAYSTTISQENTEKFLRKINELEETK